MTPLTPEALALSADLAVLLGQLPPSLHHAATQVWCAQQRCDFPLLSRTGGRYYAMVYTPEGVAVHQNEGCEGEIFNGPVGCWHSKENSKMTALVPYDSRPTAVMEFTPEHVKVLKNTIAKGASDAELQLFIYACQDTGLNPFLHQIWAIQRREKQADGSYAQRLTIQVGIDGYRVIRDRIRDADGVPLFEGMDGPQWSDDGEVWTDYPFANKTKFARVGIWRRGVPRPFVAVARYDAYAQDTPLWHKMGAEQLAKCAEALGLRRAFPAEMGKLPSGPVAEYEGPELASPAPSTALPAGALEGQVIEHGVGQQAPGEAVPPASAPAAAPPDRAQSSARQQTSASDLRIAVAEWLDVVEERKDATQRAGIAKRVASMSEAEAIAYIRRFLGESFGPAPVVAAAPAQCEHEPAFDADMRAVCAKCGVLLEDEPA